jgi:hypothetical protein
LPIAGSERELEIEAMAAANVEKIIFAWQARQRPSAFETMAKHST